MKAKGRALVLTAGVLIWLGSLAVGCREAVPVSSAASPKPADVPLRGELRWTGSYAQDIQPTFNAYCVPCHGPTKAENGLRLDTYEGVMKGTRYGAVVTPGSATSSTLVWVIQGLAAEKIRMPHEGAKLTPNRIQNIILWIDAGAKKD